MVDLLQEISSESLGALAQAIQFGRGGKRSERVIYYRLPKTKLDGTPHPQAGWIIQGDSQSEKMNDEMMRGWQPLTKYGAIRFAKDEIDDHWAAKILRAPGGPAEFPVEQILTYGWHNPDRCPVKGVRWPQLKGYEIKEFRCPECSDNPPYLTKPIHLARHLRNNHDYSPQDIIELGKITGVDFAAEIRERSNVSKIYTFEDDDLLPEEDEDDRPAVETFTPPPRRELNDLEREEVGRRLAQGRKTAAANRAAKKAKALQAA